MWENFKKGKWTFLLLVFGYTWWTLHMEYPELIYNESYIYNRLADEKVLVESFEQIIFMSIAGREVVGPFPLTKWIAPIHFNIFGKFSDSHEMTIQSLALLMKNLTGLEVRKIKSTDSGMANIRIHFAKHEELNFIANFNEGKGEDSNNIFDNAVCLEVPRENEKGHIEFAYNYISVDKGEAQATACIIEEFAHAFGPGHTSLYLPSVFGKPGWPQQLSINDKIMIRTLYDKRLKSGMTRDEAMPIVAKIIPELVAAVKERGEEALYQ